MYPTINQGVLTPLRVVLISLQDDPAYLDKPECPYAEEVKAFFREFAGAGGGESEAPSLKEPQDLERQIEVHIHDLNRMGKELTTKDHSEKLAYFRLKTSLFEKLLAAKERILNLSEIAEFQRVVLAFLQESCTADQISDVMDKLRHLESVKAKT